MGIGQIFGFVVLFLIFALFASGAVGDIALALSKWLIRKGGLAAGVGWAILVGIAAFFLVFILWYIFEIFIPWLKMR